MKRIFVVFFMGFFCFMQASQSDTKAIASPDSSLVYDDDFEAEFAMPKQTDPLYSYNKAMTKFNDFMFSNIFIPVAKGYGAVVPKSGQKAVASFFDNIMYPVRLINNLLQFKFEGAWHETQRFVANTIVGVGGLFDAASKYYHIPRSDEDFGQTLGRWGVGSGVHIVLPFLGPSNLRDSAGLVADFFISPLRLVQPDSLGWGLAGERELNALSIDPSQYEKLKGAGVALYPMLRDGYEQSRIHKIKE